MTPGDELKSLMQRLFLVSCNKELTRLGPKGDGGYHLVPNDLQGIEACFSPGVSTVSGFEKDCADLGMKVFLAEKSVEQLAEKHELFSFTKKFVGARSNDTFMTLDEWVDTSLTNTSSDLLLQIDIKGSEYEVFLSTSGNFTHRFRIIVVEFHKLEQLWNQPFFNLVSSAFGKILQAHTCVHIHPNNCSGPLKKSGFNIRPVLEFTFLRNNRISNAKYKRSFPDPLDYDNTDNPAVVLSDCWYGG